MTPALVDLWVSVIISRKPAFLHICEKQRYRNDPKFSDRLIWANSADPDQTAPRGAV